jgi:hypothetical protein
LVDSPVGHDDAIVVGLATRIWRPEPGDWLRIGEKLQTYLMVGTRRDGRVVNQHLRDRAAD